ncbi:E3 ubiquitin-protein ligase TRIM71-like [Saccostrea echinata]|uniref:E3 ubiquitin-protein ligase TRIM71-like n=1 Tax=Saccostrea echinata TaxID=191078 RepID=UPI002A809669|nr:E3 ubiquitin-protein ligase TRIM71-like [Saccostrea echinata]
MDPRYSAQDVLRCDLCETKILQSHCELCHINLCKGCVGEHLSDVSNKHRVVPYKEKGSTPNYPICQNHADKYSILYCEVCDFPVCSSCISSDEHHGHKLTDVLQKLESKIKDIENDLKELEKTLHPRYEEIALEIRIEKDKLEDHYKKLTEAVTSQGEKWHQEINNIVKEQTSKIEEMKIKHLALLEKQEEEITQNISEVKEGIVDLKEIRESNAFAYKAKSDKFRRFLSKVTVSFPCFSPKNINTENLTQQFGFLSTISVTTQKHWHALERKRDASASVAGQRIDPELIDSIHIGHDLGMYNITCLSDEEIWTSNIFAENIMKLFNCHGKILRSIDPPKELFGLDFIDMDVTKTGELVCTACEASSVYLVKNEKLEKLIQLQNWKPHSVCCSSSGDLLVIMESKENSQTKVVRYSGSTEKQTIQFDDEDNLLFSSALNSYRSITENRNLDICVADGGANEVVVVNQGGNLRFRYTIIPSTTGNNLCAYGITTDSHGHILISDGDNHCIQILDQNGQFLRHISNCDLKASFGFRVDSEIFTPFGICVDSKDNLFVTEVYCGKMKKIKYIKDKNDEDRHLKCEIS